MCSTSYRILSRLEKTALLDQGMSGKMFLLLLISFIHSVASSKLLSINPYDKDPHTKYYLHSGCKLLGGNHSEKYESEVVRNKQWDECYEKCLRAVWPGSSIKTVRGLKQGSIGAYGSFKKGQTLAHHETGKYVASEDGFALSSDTCFVNVLYYHKDKPPMNLKLLQKLPWPQDKELLNYRDVRMKKAAASFQAKQPHQPDVTIKLANNLKPISFVTFTRWIKEFFNMEKYDSAQLKKFRNILASSFPGIELLKVHRIGSKTRVMPLHDRFRLCPSGSTITTRYDPEAFEIPELVDIPKYSTIITDFEHKGTTYCLVLTFDILEEKRRKVM